MNVLITNMSVVLLTGVAGRLGKETAIGYAMGARLEYILLPLGFGFGTAIVAMVGTNWGAKQYRRAREIWHPSAIAPGTRTARLARGDIPRVARPDSRETSLRCPPLGSCPKAHLNTFLP